MADQILKHNYRLKGGKQKAVEQSNPLLDDREPIVVQCEDGITRIKIGDGVHTYNELPWASDVDHYTKTIHPIIEWDGNESGRAYYNIGLYYDDCIKAVKVSDGVVSVDDLLGTVIEYTVYDDEDNCYTFDSEIDEEALNNLYPIADSEGNSIGWSFEDFIFCVSNADKWKAEELRHILEDSSFENKEEFINNLYSEDFAEGIYVLHRVVRDTKLDDYEDMDEEFISKIEFPTTIKQIENKYIPTPDWEQNIEGEDGYVKNRTHYHTLSKTINSKFTDVGIHISNGYDGGTSYYRVSDLIPTEDQLIGSTYSSSHSTEDVYGGGSDTSHTVITESMIEKVNGIIWVYDYIAVVYDSIKATRYFEGENGEIVNDTVVPTGIYFQRSSSKFGSSSVQSLTFPEELRQLDEKYIPSTIARKADIPSIVNNSNIKNSSNSPTNYGLYQESEKDDTAVSLKFTDIKLGDKSHIVKTYDRTLTGKTGVALGSSVASGDRAFSAGSSNVAAGRKSIALGCDNYCGGNQSIALGYANYSNGISSVAAGNCNISTGSGSFAGGTESQAIEDATFAMGTGVQVSGRFAAGFGNQTRVIGDNQFVAGKFNVPNANTYFVIGNGTNESNRSNAVEVYQNGVMRLPHSTEEAISNLGADGTEVVTLSLAEKLTKHIVDEKLKDIDIGDFDIDGAVLQKTRDEVTNPYHYDHNQDSVPYIYGRYGKPNGDGTYTEKEGLIKTSIGGIKKEILAQINEDYNQGTITEDERNKYSNNVEYGLIPEKYRHMLDVHTIPMRDGNCAMPVGIHIYDEDKDGNIINSKIYYGAATPEPYMHKYVSDQINTVPTFKTVSSAMFTETDVGSFDGGYLKVTNHTDENISVGIYEEVAVNFTSYGVCGKSPISPNIYFCTPDEFGVDVEWLSENTFKPKKDITSIEVTWHWSYYGAYEMVDCSLLKGVTYRLSYVDMVGQPYFDETLPEAELFEHTGYITIVPEIAKRKTQTIGARTTTQMYSLKPNEVILPISCSPDINKLSFEAKYRPITWTQLFTGLKDGTKLGVYQHSEKDDKAVSLKFTDVNIADKSEIAKTYDRTVTGKTAAAFGSSVAAGDRAFTAGSSNVAFGGKSIALGCDNYTKADASVALGYANYTSGFAAIAAGHRTISTGNGAFSSGAETQAIGDASFTANTGTIAGGKYSAAFGNQTRALFDNQFVVGKFNDPTKLVDGDFFVVGAGSADGDRCNAFVAGKTWQGDAYIKVGDTTLTEEKIKSFINGNYMDGVTITDKTTSLNYKLYVDNGKLKMEEI